MPCLQQRRHQHPSRLQQGLRQTFHSAETPHQLQHKCGCWSPLLLSRRHRWIAESSHALLTEFVEPRPQQEIRAPHDRNQRALATKPAQMLPLRHLRRRAVQRMHRKELPPPQTRAAPKRLPKLQPSGLRNRVPAPAPPSPLEAAGEPLSWASESHRCRCSDCRCVLHR